MKKTLILIVSLVTIAILLFIVFTKADYPELTEDECLAIGEEKYLEFLWMVDGAFNNEKFNDDFSVNGKKLKDTNKKFTCIYKRKNDDSCIANNFLEEFQRVFATNISYNQVYSDGIISWIKYENGKYIFTNINNCSLSRMSLKHTIKLLSIEDDKMSFNVIFEDKSHTKERTKMFVLVKEDNTWKVSKAYYHDICEMDYYIE